MVMVQREEDLISAPAAFQSVTSSCSHRHRTLQASVFINSMAPFDPPSTMPKPPGNAPHSAVDWSSLKSLRNQYHKFILSSKKKYYSSLVSSVSHNAKRLWQTVNKLLHQRFSNWGPRTKGGPRRVPTGSARGFRKVVIVCTVFNNLRPICIQICKHKSVTQSLSQCTAWKCCRGLARQAFC